MLLGFALALLLGIKHSYDPDHLLAVSSLLTRTRSVKQTVKITLSWVGGHTITAGVITVLLFTGQSFLSSYLENFELLVGIMLIALVVISLRPSIVFHKHEHDHPNVTHSHGHIHSTEKESHYHKHMFGIGVIQGLASNDELLVFFTLSLTLTTLAAILVGIVIYGFGVAIGMIAYGFVMSYPLLKSRNKKIKDFVTIGCGILSIIYGALIILQIV